MRTRRKFGLNESNGLRSNFLVHLANCAIRTGRKLTFDPVAQRFVGDKHDLFVRIEIRIGFCVQAARARLVRRRANVQILDHVFPHKSGERSPA